MAEIPEHIKKYKSLKKKAKKITDTTEIEHSKAYLAAAEILKNEEGQIDYEKLEEPEVQEKFVSKMTEHYLERANKYFGSKVKPEDELQVNQLLKTYAGITRDQLSRFVKTFGEEYTQKKHEAVRDKFMDEVREELAKTTAAHLKEEHAPDFLKGMKGIDDIVDKEKVTLNDALILYNIYEKYGDITPKSIKSTYRAMERPSPVFLKKKKKYEKKEEE